MRQDSNSDLDLVTEPKWRVLHLIRRGLGSGVQFPTEYRVRAPGCRTVVHPATESSTEPTVQGGAKRHCPEE